MTTLHTKIPSVYRYRTNRFNGESEMVPSAIE